MTIKEAEDKIARNGGNLDTFWDWMQGNTMSLYPSGETDVYEVDVDRFLRWGDKAFFD